jgi:hypothetical protein
MALEAALAQRVSAGSNVRFDEITAEQTAGRYARFVGEHATLIRAEAGVYQEVNEFVVAVILNGNGEKEAFLTTLSTLPEPLLARTLTAYLLRTEGTKRAEWFPEVLDTMAAKLKEQGREKELSNLYVDLRREVDTIPSGRHLPEDVENGIIGYLSQFVAYDSLHQTWQSALLPNS